MSRTDLRRFRLPLYVGAVFLVVSLLTRGALLTRTDIAAHLSELPAVFAVGFLFDLATASFVLAPLGLFLALLTNRAAMRTTVRALIALGIFAMCFIFLLTAVAEWVFWEEFASRFNFIAVDYLVYTHEVLGNIWQSYPVGKILTALAVVALLVAAVVVRQTWNAVAAPVSPSGRLLALGASIALPLLAGAGLSSTDKDRFAVDALNELAGNGYFEFVAAAKNNEMDYLRLYATIPEQEAFATVRAQLAATTDAWRSGDPQDPEHQVVGSAPERRLNVVLISVESLGAEFLGTWGNTQGLTPRLDALARDSLIFTNAYATGNRTVRGLEALSLSLPPTPGQSIVKRPLNKNLFTLGAVFEDKGYDTMFVYGGYGYFDNMNAYFAENDYRTVDRRAIASERIHYENIWGVADEDLFDLAIEEISRSLKTSAGKKPVFAHIMTTTNHRPYTYPDGRVDIPSGTSREGAVKYTDWALGHFLDEARKQPWFNDTLFVITADHGASARGTSEIPIEKYRIPVFFYAPAHLKPGRIDRLMSQIDIPPTLLGRLDFTYRSKFFGQDLFRTPPGNERAFVANYQTLGYLHDGRLVTLQPRKQTRVSADLHAGAQTADGPEEQRLLREAIAWYEAASLAFRRGLYQDEEHAAEPPVSATAKP